MNTHFDTSRAGVALLRIALGVMFISHSVILKFFIFTLPGTAQYFQSVGLPGPLAYLVFAAESIGGMLLLFNIRTRWVSLALLPILAGATWVHSANGWIFENTGGGWEYPAFLFATTLVLALVADPTRRSDSTSLHAVNHA